MKRKIALLLGLLMFTSTPFSSASDENIDHSQYGKILSQFVKDGDVDYEGIQANRKDLDDYLASLATVPESDFKAWPKGQQMTFLINLYNAATLRLIIDNYPVKGIKNIGSVLKGPWDQPAVKMFGGTSTLNTIEHKMLRVNYDDPRVHFALVCGARGCPPLRSEPYESDRLNEQLDDQGRIFLSTKEKNSVDLSSRTLNISPIFKWFEGDFKKRSGSVIAFIKPYFPEAQNGTIQSDFKIKYTGYDWSLNKK